MAVTMKQRKKNLETGQFDVVQPGPKPVAITPEEIVALASMFTTIEEMAGYFGLSTRQLYRRFANDFELMSALRTGRSKGKVLLRQAQFKSAVGGDARLLVWMGKQFLDQSEKVQIIHGMEEELIQGQGINDEHRKSMKDITGRVKELDGEEV